ncbi:MAG: hypothetical protein HYX22_01460 [Candidatus Yanofskybacteria bacterium]|nr:hypothetical protein [Candidatus Yanofskybacteria bacterium]
MPVMKHRHLDGDRTMVEAMPLLHSATHDDFLLKAYPFDTNRWSGHAEAISHWFLEGGLHKNLVEKFKVTTGVMQNPFTIFYAVKNFVVINGRRGFCGEFIIAPQYHVFGDACCPQGTLTEKDVMNIVIKGIKAGEKQLKKEGVNTTFNVWWGIGREVSPEEAVRLTRVALEYDPDDVLGISLVCHEPSAPPEKFVDAFRLAKREKRKTACHVEWVKDRKENEKDTPDKIHRNFQEDLPQLTKNLTTAIFDLDVDQIDHGFGLAENPELMKVVADKGTVVTVCPGSLLTTRLINNIKMLKIREMLDAGILLCWDVDDDICMPAYNQLEQMYREAYAKPPSAENLDRLKEDLDKLERNAELALFGNRKEHKC